MSWWSFVLTFKFFIMSLTTTKTAIKVPVLISASLILASSAISLFISWGMMATFAGFAIAPKQTVRIAAAGAGASAEILPACSDGIDNNGDGRIDLDDPRCQDASDSGELVRWVSDPIRHVPPFSTRGALPRDQRQGVDMPLLGNFDEDVALEVAVFQTRVWDYVSNNQDAPILIYDSNGSLLTSLSHPWTPVLDPNQFIGDQLVDDLDGDGSDEIIFSTIYTDYSRAELWIVRNGSQLERLSTFINDTDIAITSGYLMGDVVARRKAIIVRNNLSQRNGYELIAFDEQGSILGEQTMGGELRVSRPYLADIDGDRNSEIIVYTQGRTSEVSPASANIRIVSTTGILLTTYEVTNIEQSPEGCIDLLWIPQPDKCRGPSSFINDMAIGDMDSDGALELVVATIKGVIVLGWDDTTNGLRQLWSYDYTSTSGNIEFDFLFLSLGDITGDGRLDIVGTFFTDPDIFNPQVQYYGAIAISNEGSQLWEYVQAVDYDHALFPDFPTLVNIDGDQGAEVFFGSRRKCWVGNPLVACYYPPEGSNATLILLDNDGLEFQEFHKTYLNGKNIQNTVFDYHGFEAYSSPVVGYLGVERRPGIVFTGTLLYHGERSDIGDTSYVFTLDNAQISDRQAYPLWPMRRKETTGHSRINACDDDYDCQRGQIYVTGVCVENTCEYSQLTNLPFRRGDANGDGWIDISDPISTLSAVYLNGTPLNCQDAADANDSGALDKDDAIFTLRWLFDGSGMLPPLPGTETLGSDLTDDGLGCTRYP